MLALQERANASDVALERAGRIAEFEAEMITKARQSAFAGVRRRAHAYLRDPLQLEAIAHGLAYASPECLMATGRTILDHERRFPSRHFGVGGEVKAMNAKAIMVLGRYQRRMWCAIKRGA
jgi:hypothetical protein